MLPAGTLQQYDSTSSKTHNPSFRFHAFSARAAAECIQHLALQNLTDQNDIQHAGQQVAAASAIWYRALTVSVLRYLWQSSRGRYAYHNGKDTPVDDILRQPGLQLQLSKGTLASNELPDAGAKEASHCSQIHA